MIRIDNSANSIDSTNFDLLFGICDEKSAYCLRFQRFSEANLTSTKTRAVVDEDSDKHLDIIVTYNPLDTSALVFIGGMFAHI